MRRFTRLTSTVALSCLAIVPAWASDTPDAVQPDNVSANSEYSGDIVVTARRREEVLSRVPVAVTALQAETLEQKNIRTEVDLQSAVPGLIVKQTGGSNLFNYVIRGQTIDTYTSSPPGVLPYVNEAQVVTNAATTFYDMGGIQVLKGPQGTLFGRNATGGAVLFSTAQPTDEFGGYVRARYGNYEAYGIEGAINLPIAESIKLRIAAQKVGGGAFSHLLDDDKRYGNLEQRSIRGTLLLEPVSGVKNTTMVQYTRDGGTNTANVLYKSGSYGCDGSAGSPFQNASGNTSTADCFYSGYAGNVAAFSQPPNPVLSDLLTRFGIDPATAGPVAIAAVQNQLGPWKVIGNNVRPTHSAKSFYGINTTEIELSSNLTIKNILMLNDSRSSNATDYDGSPFPILDTGFGTLQSDFLDYDTDGADSSFRTKQFSNELQLQGKTDDGKLQYTLGVYYVNQRDYKTDDVSAFNFHPFSPAIFTRYHALTRDKSIALFAQATYELADALHLTGGIRYTWEKISQIHFPDSVYYDCAANPAFGPGVCVGQGPEQLIKTKSSKPSWNLSLDYQVTPNLMVYAATRGSWRAGSLNPSLPPNPILGVDFGNGFLPETIRDVEFGAKYSGSDAIGVPFVANIALYKQWVKDVQRVANVSFNNTAVAVTVNVPEAQIYGIEFDTSVRPTNWLNIGGVLAYTHARFTKNVVNLLNNPTFFYGPYADVPKVTGSVFAEATADLGAETGSLTFRGDMFFQGQYAYSNLNDTLNPDTEIDAYKLVHARVTWDEVMGSEISIAAYARNLFNKQYYTGGFSLGYALGLNAAVVGAPRTYGVEVKVPF